MNRRFNRKQNSLIRINIKGSGIWFLYVFLALPHLKPPYLSTFPTIDIIIDVWRGISFIFVILWYILKKKQISIVVILAMAWQLSLLLSTIYNQGAIYSCVVTSFSILSIMLFYDIAQAYKEIFLSSQLFCFELVIYINLITEFVFPAGMYLNNGFPSGPNWFLGYYNGYTKYFIPALMFAWLYKESTGKKWRTLILFVGIVASTIIVFAGGQAVALAIMVFVFLFFKDITMIFNYYNYWLLHIIFVTVISLPKFQEIFIWFLNNILKKTSSYLTRARLWDKTFYFFLQSPLIGYGVQTSSSRIAQYRLPYGIHAHNMLLELLYQGGIIGFILWIALIVVSGRIIYKYRNTLESKIIAIAFLGWCIVTLVEPFTTPFFMGMFVIAHRSNQEI